MLKVKETSRFKSSFKKYRHDKTIIAELKQVLVYLKNRELLPCKYKDHSLKGSLRGVRECHLQPDTLLLYFVIEDEILKLIDIGSHSNALKM